MCYGRGVVFSANTAKTMKLLELRGTDFLRLLPPTITSVLSSLCATFAADYPTTVLGIIPWPITVSKSPQSWLARNILI